VQLRPGERLTRNWSNKGLHVNMNEGKGPDCLNSRGRMSYQTKLGDLAPGRVGNGTLEYEPALASPEFKAAALAFENLAPGQGGTVMLADPNKPGVLVFRMPSSYVYLGGTLTLKSAVGQGGEIVVSFSDNNGLDWKEIAKVNASGDQTVDLKPLVFRRYDYRLKFEMKGAGTGLSSLKVVHDVQHSQAPLPILTQGVNNIAFSAGPQEGTVTIEGSTNIGEAKKGKQLAVTDFHPQLNNVDPANLKLTGGKGDVTFPVSTPGDMTRIRFGAHYRARDARDVWEMQVSFNNGDTWKTVDKMAGPFRGNCKYVTFSEIPAGTKAALVRFSGTQGNTCCIFDFRIDADYKEPAGGFRPVQITYLWTENGAEKKDVHVAQKPDEKYQIKCDATPVMKSLIVELAK
jgi:hypothetical protein